VVVLLTDEEFATVKECAGLVPLSTWFRSLVVGPRVRPVAESNAGTRPRAIAAEAEPAARVPAAAAEEAPAVRPHTFHSGRRPVPGCGACAELKADLARR